MVKLACSHGLSSIDVRLVGPYEPISAWLAVSQPFGLTEKPYLRI